MKSAIFLTLALLCVVGVIPAMYVGWFWFLESGYFLRGLAPIIAVILCAVIAFHMSSN